MNDLSTMSSSSGAAGGKARIVGGDEMALRLFLSMYFRDTGRPRGGNTIYIGQLPPEGFPVNLPLPETAAIVGCVVSEDGTIQLWVTASGLPEVVTSQFESLLVHAGWQVGNWPWLHEEFFSDRPAQRRWIRHEATQRTLSLTVESDDHVDSVICMTTSFAPNAARSPFTDPWSWQPLPALVTPPGARLLWLPDKSGAWGGARYLTSSIGLISDRTASELAAAYHEQLAALDGWQQVMVQNGEGWSISTWAVTHGDSRWSGHLTLVTDPLAPGFCFAHLYLYEHLV